MSRNLGGTNYKDDKDLRELMHESGYDIEYYDLDAIWEEAKKYHDETGNDSAEVIVAGSDYITVEFETPRLTSDLRNKLLRYVKYYEANDENCDFEQWADANYSAAESRRMCEDVEELAGGLQYNDISGLMGL